MGIKPEAASLSSIYRVLAVRTGGGIWSGCFSPTSGGHNVFPRKHFCLARPFLWVFQPKEGCYPEALPIGRGFDTAYRDACLIGNATILNVARYLFHDMHFSYVKGRFPSLP